MKISYNWLQSFFRGKLPDPKKAAELVTFHSVEVEAIERRESDYVFTLDVLPNRSGDLLSHRGVARELHALTGIAYSGDGPIGHLKESNDLNVGDLLSVNIERGGSCPRYTARVLWGVRVTSSPGWLKERLRAVGIRSINNIVDATNYVMMELGQPLHAFDLDKIKSMESRNQKSEIKKKSKIPKPELQTKKIIVRRAKKRERITTLDGKERYLNDSTIVIADSGNPIAIAGIMGGQHTEVANSTKNLILESANFDPTTIRKSSRMLGLRTESSLRFEYGLDQNLAGEAVDRLAALIYELAGGKIARGRIDIYPKKVKPKKIRLDNAYAIRLLGASISSRVVKDILKRLGFDCVEAARSGTTLVTIPTFRQDINIQEDLIEEIGRIYGYGRIPESAPVLGVAVSPREDHREYSRLLRKLLPALGYSETYNISFWGERMLAHIGLKTKNCVQLENPVNENAAYLRSNILPLVLENVAFNLAHTRNIKLFEIGKVYMKARARSGYAEKEQIGFVATEHMSVPSPSSGFYKVKGEVEWLLEGLGILDVSFLNLSKHDFDSTGNIWHPRNSAAVEYHGEHIGMVGEIDPAILRNFRIKERVVAADLDFEAIVKYAGSGNRYYTPLPRYPSALRDIAILVPFEVRVEEVLNVIHREGGMFVKDVDLFDMYEGEEVPEGKKNLAFHIVYQADDRTLTDKDVDVIHKKIERALVVQDWEVR